MKKKLSLLICAILCMSCFAHADENYTDWEQEDVVGLYVEISQEEAKRNGFDESFTDGSETRYFEKVKVDEGIYKVEVREKVDSKFWKIAYSDLFMKFRYNPFLYRFDEGILDWNRYDGTFYKKP